MKWGCRHFKCISNKRTTKTTVASPRFLKYQYFAISASVLYRMLFTLKEKQTERHGSCVRLPDLCFFPSFPRKLTLKLCKLGPICLHL